LKAIAFSNISKAVTWGPSVQVREEEEDGHRVKVIVNAVLLVPMSQSSTGALRIKMHNKLAALVVLGKYLGMFDERPQNSNVIYAISDEPMKTLVDSASGRSKDGLRHAASYATSLGSTCGRGLLAGGIARCNKCGNPPYYVGLNQQRRVALIRVRRPLQAGGAVPTSHSGSAWPAYLNLRRG